MAEEVINRVHIKGRVLRSADAYRHGRTAGALFFALAVPGKDREQESYVDCLALPDTYEQFEGYLEEGDVAEVEGSFVYRTWTDGRGVRRSGPEVLVEKIDVYEED